MNRITRAKIVGLYLFLLAAFGCGLHGHGGGGGTGDKADASPLDAMTRSINAQMNTKSYRMRMELSSAGHNLTDTLEIVWPDRYHMVSTTNEGTGSETIVVGSTAYVKIGNSPWHKSPADAGQMMFAFQGRKIEEMRKIKEIQLVGTDTLDGMPVRVYQWVTEGTFVAKAWISTADDLPRKMEVEGEVKGNKTKSTVTFSDYNAALKVEPPM
jgi:hypothetical protein